MTSSPAHPGTSCVECYKAGRYQDARRTLTLDDGRIVHLCVNHAAARIHAANIYDQTMNPTGKR